MAAMAERKDTFPLKGVSGEWRVFERRQRLAAAITNHLEDAVNGFVALSETRCLCSGNGLLTTKIYIII